MKEILVEEDFNVNDLQEVNSDKKNKDKKIEKNKTLEVDDFKFTKSGSLIKDLKKIEIKTNEVAELEVEEIRIRDTGNFLNVKESVINIPIELTVFPFFTPQNKNRKVNFKYYFEDLGVTMYSTLILKDKGDEVFQPSILEEKIFMFLMSLYEEKIKDKKDEDDEYIEFEISDFIVKFLGNKMNRVYYSKVEQALKNLKNTQYQFEVSNHTKLGKYKFEDEEFKLLNYQKLKTGNKIFYKVSLHKNIKEKIKRKRYIRYYTKPLVEMMAKDHIAARIYKYISQIRYDKNVGVINIRTLAAIIPLKIDQVTERMTKKGIPKIYLLSRIKPVLNRIIKAFNVLKELGYLTKFNEEYNKTEDTYYITYYFNKNMDGNCHTSEYVKRIEVKRVADDIIKKEEISKYEEYSDELYLAIKNARKNPNISSLWNKRVENKIDKILAEYGENLTIRILEILKSVQEIKFKTLTPYINGIIKNLKAKKESPNMNMSLFLNANTSQKVIKSKSQINKFRNKKAKENGTTPIKKEKIYKEQAERINYDKLELEQFDEKTQNEILQKALELFKEKESDSGEIFENLRKTNEKMFYRMYGSYVTEIINIYYKNK